MSEQNNTEHKASDNMGDVAEKKSVQEKLTDLSDLVSWFQGSSFKLETALDKFKAAEALADQIEKDLTKLKNDIKIVKKKFDSDN